MPTQVSAMPTPLSAKCWPSSVAMRLAGYAEGNTNQAFKSLAAAFTQIDSGGFETGQFTQAENLFYQSHRNSSEVKRENGWSSKPQTTSAQFWIQLQNRREDARELIAGIYGRFTEGFETPAFKQAKALLDELSVTGLSALRDMCRKGNHTS